MPVRRRSDFGARTDYLRWPVVEKLIDRRDELAWYLLNFALWHEMWIEGEPGGWNVEGKTPTISV